MTPSRLDTLLEAAWGGLVLLALAFLPLFVFPPAYNPFIPPKVALVGTVAVLGLLLALGRMLAGRRVRLPLHRTGVWTLAFLAWNLLLWPLAQSRSLAMERVAFLWLVFVVAWMWQEWTRARRDRFLICLRTLAASAFLTSAWALYQDVSAKWGAFLPASIQGFFTMAPKLPDWRGFVTAGLGNTDHVAAFLATFYLPFLLAMIHARSRPALAAWALVLWAMTAAMIVCWSVGANGSLIVGSAIVLIGIGKKRREFAFRQRAGRVAVWAAGCCVVVLWLVTPTSLNPHRPGIFQEAFGSDRWIEGGPTRGVIWLNALEMIRRHQFLGVGPGCFTYVFPSMQSAFVPNDPSYLAYQGLYTNAAHNSLLQTWAELGPVGALLLIAIVVAAFRALLRAARAGGWMDGWIAWGGIGALATMVLTSIMTFPLELPVSTVYFFCLIPLGEVLDQSIVGRRGFRMPALVLQERWGEIALDMRDMKRVEAVEGAFSLPRPVAATAFVLAAALSCLWIAHVWRPVASDTIYRQAHSAAVGASRAEAGSAADRDPDVRRTDVRRAEADRLFRRALAIWPRHHDCRSEYSSFVLDEGRDQECIDQLALVFRRLDSPELYLRRAKAWDGLGEPGNARRDRYTYFSRLPAARPDLPGPTPPASPAP